jgi:hypothetical protein
MGLRSLGFAIGFRGVGLGADVAQAEALASPSEGERPVAGTVVGHHALHFDTKA